MQRFIEEVEVALPKPVAAEAKVILKEAAGQGAKLVLKPKIEAIHATTTRNYITYPEEVLKGDKKKSSGVYSCLYPYPKPILKNHDTYEEPLGRIKEAVYVTNGRSGKAAIVIQPEITDKDAIEKFLDGRYHTVSIGAMVEAARCSICGTDIVNEGLCDHYKGRRYDSKGNETDNPKGKLCTYVVEGNLWIEEVSVVNSPGDVEAQVAEIGEITEAMKEQHKDAQLIEAYVVVGDKAFNLSKLANEEGFCIEAKKLTEEAHLITLDEELAGNSGNEQQNSSGVQADTWESTNLVHGLLHTWWKHPEKTTWSKQMLIKWHKRVVSALVQKNNHTLTDGLDETLNASLKKKSNGGSKK